MTDEQFQVHHYLTELDNEYLDSLKGLSPISVFEILRVIEKARIVEALPSPNMEERKLLEDPAQFNSGLIAYMKRIEYKYPPKDCKVRCLAAIQF